jgi:hypothetical protein
MFKTLIVCVSFRRNAVWTSTHFESLLSLYFAFKLASSSADIHTVLAFSSRRHQLIFGASRSALNEVVRKKRRVILCETLPFNTYTIRLSTKISDMLWQEMLEYIVQMRLL